MKINDMEIQIYKNWYNKSKLQPDGITHIIDTETQYPVFQLGIAKNYFVDTKEKAIGEIISDLKELVVQLEQLQNKDKDEMEK